MRDGKIVNWFHWFQDIIVLWRSSVGPPLAVHADLGAVAVPLQLHLVPITVAHHLVGQPHKAIAFFRR